MHLYLPAASSLDLLLLSLHQSFNLQRSNQSSTSALQSIMAPHSDPRSDNKSSNHYLELLPPATYIPGTRRASFNSNRHPFAASRSTMPTPEEVKAAVTRSRRSSSASTASSVASSYDGERNRFLQLVPESDE